MKTYKISITEEAMMEEEALFRYLCEEIHAPLTAMRYIAGLRSTIKKLERTAGTLAKEWTLTRQMGFTVYRTRYKSTAIIYSIEDDMVYIHHIIPQKMVVYPTSQDK